MPKRRPTPAQIAAARRNGALSKGPRQKPYGNTNALTHGLTAATVLLAGESRERFEQLQSQVIETLQPQSILELTAVEEIVISIWKQRRSWALEAAALKDAAAPAHARDHPTQALHAWRQLHKNGHHFTNLLLQQARVNQQLDRAYRRFLLYAALRQNEEPLPENETKESNNV